MEFSVRYDTNDPIIASIRNPMWSCIQNTLLNVPRMFTPAISPKYTGTTVYDIPLPIPANIRAVYRAHVIGTYNVKNQETINSGPSITVLSFRPIRSIRYPAHSGLMTLPKSMMDTIHDSSSISMSKSVSWRMNFSTTVLGHPNHMPLINMDIVAITELHRKMIIDTHTADST